MTLLANAQAYMRAHARYIGPVLALFVAALAMPIAPLFQERAAGMLDLHLLLELFAVIVALLIAVIAWHDASMQRSREAGVLLCGFTVVAVMDLVHALTYDGMPPLLTASSTVRAIYFWLMGRSAVALTLLLLLLGVRPQWSRWVWLGLGVTLSAVLFYVGTFALELFPVTFVPGRGVTAFKARYEYVLSLVDVGLVIGYVWRATPANRGRYFAIATSCLVMAMGEYVFSDYKAPSDFLNIFGHSFKIVSYALLYQNVFVVAIQEPYRRVQDSEARFRALTELSSDWYWEQDAQWRFTQLSAAPLSPHRLDIIGKTRWDIDGIGLTPEQWATHRDVLERHEPFAEFEYPMMTANGQLRWVSVSGTPMWDESGAFVGYRGVGKDITERKSAERQIEFLAYYDVLTGLPNRALLQDRFEQARTQAAHAQRKMLLMFLDLDNFKSINDTLGHDMGDTVVRETAERLRQSVRDTDTVCREGGDEFLLLCPDVAHTDDLLPMIVGLLERLRQPIVVKGHDIVCTASIGIAVLPDDGDDFETLRRKADLAMYRAKAAGRNTYHFFNEAMQTEASEHLAVRSGLRRALDRGEFRLHYQPQFDLRSGEVIGVEALLRWQHPEQGMVAPGRFIPVAEDSGLIVPIGEWVLREACQQAVAWQQAGLPPMTIAVNLSAVQFQRGDVEQSVRAALAATGLAPALLELELTESILLQNTQAVLETLQGLKQLGVLISIDDFGTGYSSLSYLKRFDIDKLKIDQSFVRDLAHDPDDAAIVRAIIQMAHGLNLRTVAEGVENAELLAHLQALGCDEAQGFHFLRPQAATELEGFVRAHWSARATPVDESR